MAVELWVFLDRDRLPSASTWAKGVAAAGFELSFVEERVSPASHGGFLPMRFEGEETGFEFDVHPVERMALTDQLKELVSQLDSVATFRFTDDDQLVAALAASAVLATLAGGVLHDPNDEPTTSDPAAFLSTARELRAVQATARAAQAIAKRTPAEWAKMCLGILQRIHPDYEKNKLIKGTTLEFIRRHESGLHISHNFIRIRTSYRQGFALLFSPRQPWERLHSPFVCGGRFDHNFDVRAAFQRDLGAGRITSSHEWRSNTPRLVEVCFEAAERQLLPHYVAVIARGAEALIRLYTTARDLLEQLELPAEPNLEAFQRDPFAAVYASAFGLTDRADWSSLARHADALLRARGLGVDVEGVLEARHSCLNTKATALAGREGSGAGDVAFVLNNIDDFFAMRDELPAALETLGRLRTS